MSFSVHFEQSVYGSFPFWGRGYAVLARSQGCRDDWLAALKLAARRFGEPPPGAGACESLFATRIARGPWMVVGVFPQGCDDRGRPGALAFHALFVGPWAYRWAGASPFSFAPALRGAWTSEDIDRRLPTGSFRPGRRKPSVPGEDDADEELSRRIAEAMCRGRGAVVRSAGPIDLLARRVWARLPGRVRRGASVATWAYGNENRFALLGTPRILGGDRDGGTLVIDRISGEGESDGPGILPSPR
jgi:hypothetical protein